MDHRASPGGTFRFPLFPSLVERGFAAARSSQGRARQRAAEPRLTARTDAKQSRGEGKSHFLICFTHYEVRIPKEFNDLQTQTEMLSASTPTAVRGIATDAGDGIIYVTAPDSNSLINIP